MKKLLYVLLLLPLFVQGQSIHITTASDTVCNGLPVQFTAADTGASLPHYRWVINGLPVPGADSSVFIEDSLNSGDSIVCLLTNSADDTVLAASNGLIITVLPVPFAGVITGPDSEVCVGATITLSDTVAGGVWSASNTCASAADGVVTGISGVLQEFRPAPAMDSIYYIVSNLHCSDTAYKIVEIQPLPYAGFYIDGHICVLGFVPINDGEWVGGTMYSTNGNTELFFSGMGGYEIMGVRPGTDYVYCIAANICRSDTFGMTVTIDDTPTIYSFSASATTLCVGSVITVAQSGTGDPEWQLANGNAGFTSNGIIGVSAGADEIRVISSNACGYASRSIAITVNGPRPITGPDLFCEGESIQFTDSTAGGIWSSSNTSAITVDQSGKLTGIERGGAIIAYTDPSTGCNVSRHADVYPTTLPFPIAGISQFCLGSSIYLSDSTGGGKWSSSNTLVASVNAAGAVAGRSEGAATITYSLNGCNETKDVSVSVCKSEMFVYPNPGQEEVTIYAFDNVYNAYLFINAIGQKVLQGSLDGPFTNVNVQLLAAGFYSIIISGPEEKHVFKFVKD